MGKISEEQEKVYNLVLNAQLAAIDAVKAGVPCNSIDAVARDMIYGAGYEGRFGHGLGHSLGLEIQITELDIHATDPSEEGMQMLAERYGKLFRILLKAKKEGLANVTSVTFWGMKDDESWLTGFRKERSYPMLFDDNYELKAAYYAVVKAVEEV